MKFKNQSVTIVKDDLGNTIRVSKRNAEYAHIRLAQEKTVINNGWVNVKTISTLLHGKTETLIASGVKKYKKLPGNIVVIESFEGEERDLKMAGKTDVVCCQDGQPIYRTTKYDATGTLEDVLIPHTNGQAIKDTNKAMGATLADLNNSKVSDSNESMIQDEKTEEVDDNQVDLEDAIAEVEAEALETPELDEEGNTSIVYEGPEIDEEVEEEVEVEEENVFTL
jgi:hypothetical protein